MPVEGAGLKSSGGRKVGEAVEGPANVDVVAGMRDGRSGVVSGKEYCEVLCTGIESAAAAGVGCGSDASDVVTAAGEDEAGCGDNGLKVGSWDRGPAPCERCREGPPQPMTCMSDCQHTGSEEI